MKCKCRIEVRVEIDSIVRVGIKEFYIGGYIDVYIGLFDSRFRVRDEF